MKNLKVIFISILLFSAISCSDFLDQIDLDELTSDSVFKTETDMTFALSTLYNYLPGGDILQEMVPYFWTDDALHRNINSQGRLGSDYQWLTIAQTGNVYVLDDFYRYDRIADINFFLEALENAEYSSEELRNRHGAEARFIRALIYERMVLAYGDVPLITSIIEPEDLPGRTSRQEVFDFVISELTEVSTQLPVSYPASEYGRITRGAAFALLSRAYLNALGWHSNSSELYAGAERACAQIVNSEQYSLAPGIEGFVQQFTAPGDQSTETVLSNNYVPELRVQSLARTFAQKGSWRGPEAGFGNNQSRPGYTSFLIDEIQTINGLFPKDDPIYDPAKPTANRDPRMAVSVVMPGDSLPAKGNPEEFYIYEPHPAVGTNTDDITRPSNPSGYSFRKYIDYSLSALDRGDADFKIIRYSEVLLMYAEALAGQDRNADALAYLDQVRQRVGMPAYADIGLPTVSRGTTGNQMIDAILLERRYEFMGEGPQRWFDIWRYRLGDQVITPVFGIPESTELYGDLDGPKFKPDNGAYDRVWQDRNYLLPIRQDILDANPSLTQNPGW